MPGTYVTSLEPALLLESTSLATRLVPDQTVVELFEVRRLLEPGAAALAAVRMTEVDLAELRADLDRMQGAPTIEELVEADADFHARVAAAAGNTVLSSLLASLSTRTMHARLWHGLADSAALTLQEHARIHESLEARDPELARAAAAVHVATSERWLREMLERGRSRLPRDEVPPADRAGSEARVPAAADQSPGSVNTTS